MEIGFAKGFRPLQSLLLISWFKIAGFQERSRSSKKGCEQARSRPVPVVDCLNPRQDLLPILGAVPSKTNVTIYVPAAHQAYQLRQPIYVST